jgi:hexokinase
MVNSESSYTLFVFLAKQIEKFLMAHHLEHFEQAMFRINSGETIPDKHLFRLGFTFSFPVEQSGINKGKLIRWTKGFDIQDAIGKDICSLLQDAIDELNLPVIVAALVNDTVGTLMARSYTSAGKHGALLGGIFGTGTNGAYVEKLDKIKKLKDSKDEYDKSTGEMIINTEWGSFDNALKVLPDTKYDQYLDKISVNPGIQMFEKRVSGMFLGELLRQTLLDLMKNENARLFHDTTSGESDIGTTTCIEENSPLYKDWGVDTSFLSLVEADNSNKLTITRQALEKDLLVEAPSIEDAQAVKLLAHAIGKRSAYLGAIAIGAVVVATNKLESSDIVDIGLDGSLVEFYPGFENHIRDALREIPEIGEEGEKRIQIGIAKDGSGVGAALIALVSGK